ncbi:MAG: vitamin K epoxide reductase family protein [bacterium]|nr:vitamin K epoxide reductase family protein [bacterium]
MTQREVSPDEDLLDEERELLALDRGRASEHQVAGGAPRDLAWMMVIGGIVGLYASLQLVMAEMTILRNPDAILGCDINPILACSTSLSMWQSQLLFGMPNALVGTAVFGLVIGVGLMFLAGARVASWFWQLMSLTVLAGLAFVAWFAYQSMANIRTLCPWCMVSWAVVIVVGYQVIGRAAQAGHLPVGEGASRFLFRERWLLTIATFAIIIALIIITFWTQWSLLLGI